MHPLTIWQRPVSGSGKHRQRSLLIRAKATACAPIIVGTNHSVIYVEGRLAAWWLYRCPCPAGLTLPGSLVECACASPTPIAATNPAVRTSIGCLCANWRTREYFIFFL